MEGNFYIGEICQKKRRKKTIYKEKMVLYTNNDIDYIDLINNVVYSTDSTFKYYVLKESLIPTNVVDHKVDYMYLLYQYNSKITAKIKMKSHC